MDDSTAMAASWCDEVRGLCDGAAGEPWSGGVRGGSNGRDAGLARLDAIAAGMKVRRHLDGLVPDEATEKARRAVVEPARRARAAGGRGAGRSSQPGTARHREVAARARQWLAEARVAAQNVLTVLQFEPLHQAMAIEALARRPRMAERGRRPARRRGPPCPDGLARRRARAAARRR